METGKKIHKFERADRGRKGIYILPNLFTTASLFSAFYGIVQATNGFYEHSAIAIVVAAVLDSLDGRVARMTNTVSDFGKEYDSLVDLVAFGLAPALVLYEWGLKGFGKLGWLIAFIYAATTALRLARFNTQDTKGNKYFRGLPCPAAAVLVATALWTVESYGLTGTWTVVTALLAMIVLSAAMVSSFPYRSFKDLDLKNRVPFMALLALVLVFVLISFDPPVVLLLLSAGFALSGPFFWLFGTKPEFSDLVDESDIEVEDEVTEIRTAGSGVDK